MPLLGELSALLTAFLWSVTSILFAAAAIRIGSIQLNVTRQLFAIIILGVIIFLFQIEYSLSSSQIYNLAVSGLFGLAFGDSFLFKAYQQIGARVSMLIMSSAPIISAILAYFVLNEMLCLWGIVGMFITIDGKHYFSIRSTA
jgi:drug/metabolite transporter (DMT)-like permease